MASNFVPEHEQLPLELKQVFLHNWQRLQEKIAQHPYRFVSDPDFLANVARVWTGSEFITELCLQQPQMVEDLFASGLMARELTPHEYIEQLSSHLDELVEAEQLDSQLRYFRRQAMFRIAWRDLADLSSLQQTTAELSALADACITLALDFLYHNHASQVGYPYDAKGHKLPLIVVALGKLGGYELNFSSDVDLMFVYPAAGHPSGAKEAITQADFFTHVTQRLVKTLSAVNAQGFVFRVDLRLRPLGSVGPVVIDFPSMQDYYYEQGRDWERYALVKARVLGNDEPYKAQLIRMISGFVYRDYQDYSAFNALREIKKIMRQDTKSRSLENDIKRGPGGIREIEFSVQVLQLICGGREVELQQKNMLNALQVIEQGKHLSERHVTLLRQAYIFLRNTEHRLQQWKDKQTQILPTDETARQRLAFVMGYSDSASFYYQLERHRLRVEKYFNQLLVAPEGEHVLGKLVAGQADLQNVWWGKKNPAQSLAILHGLGVMKPDNILRQLALLREREKYQKLKRKDKQWVDILLPILIYELLRFADQQLLLERVISLLVRIMRRPFYTRLLLAHTHAREQLLILANASPWIANQLTEYPALLEDLTDPRALYLPLDEQTLQALLHQSLIGIAQDDVDQQMDCLRRFKHTHVLRVAAAETMTTLPLMKVSNYLTFIAAVILLEVQSMVTQQLLLKHGHPTDGQGKSVAVEFSTIAYGKLGGLELSYASDLDLVFIHADVAREALTDGDEPISNQVFYTRLAQGIIHILSVATKEGVLYKVDMRLRPSGNSGLLVCSMQAFSDYQNNVAWTWEHQALVRAQAVSGTEQLRGRFAEVRTAVLAKPRLRTTLVTDVVTMRERMRSQVVAAPEGKFDVKQGVGGITDIEFLVQFAVLFWSQHYPSLLVYPDNIRVIEALVRECLLTMEQGAILCDAYRHYRSIVHRCHLQDTLDVVAETAVAPYPAAVKAIWDTWLIE